MNLLAEPRPSVSTEPVFIDVIVTVKTLVLSLKSNNMQITIR